VAIVLLCAIVIASLTTYRFVLELPIDAFMAIAFPQWVGGVILLLLLSWFLDDTPHTL
jgi:hypothetical protein